MRVDRRKIDLAEPLKRIGRYQVPIELFPDVTVDTRVLVVPEGGELPPEEELQAIEEAEAAEAAAAEAAAEEERAAAEAAIEEELAPEEEEVQPESEAASHAEATGPKLRRRTRRHPRQPARPPPPRSHKSRTDSPQASVQGLWTNSTKNPLAARNSRADSVRRAGDDVRQAGENRSNVRSLPLQAAACFGPGTDRAERRLSTR